MEKMFEFLTKCNCAVTKIVVKDMEKIDLLLEQFHSTHSCEGMNSDSCKIYLSSKDLHNPKKNINISKYTEVKTTQHVSFPIIYG